jgi:hypothetical protein
MLALLPVAAAVSVPSAEARLHSAFVQPLAAVGASFRSTSTDEAERPSDLWTITFVGVGLFGLAAMVRKSTGT